MHDECRGEKHVDILVHLYGRQQTLAALLTAYLFKKMSYWGVWVCIVGQSVEMFTFNVTCKILIVLPCESCNNFILFIGII